MNRLRVKIDYINQLTGYGLRRHTYPQTLQWTIKRKHATIYAYRDAAARELSGGDVLQTVVAQRDALHRRPELYLEEGVAQLSKGETATMEIPAEKAFGKKGFPGIMETRNTIIYEVELLDFVGRHR